MLERTQFTFYESFYKAISRIKNDSDRAVTYDAICAYALYGTMPNLDSLPDAAAIAFELVKPNLDASRRKAAGGKKGSPSKDSEKIPERPGKDTANKKEKENEKKKEIEKEKEVEDECLIPASGPANNPHVAAAVSDYLNRINPTASPTSLEELSIFAAELGADVCKRAFDIALDNKKATWPYIKAILQDKQRRGIKSLAEWDASEAERNMRKDEGKHGSSNSNPGENQRVGRYL